MNSKQRRKQRRKHPHVVNLDISSFATMLELRDWLMNHTKGDYVANETTWQGVKFSNEQDAIMCSLKFSGRR